MRARVAMVFALGFACGSEPVSGPTAGAPLSLTFTGLAALDPSTEGSYEAWVRDAGGGVASAGRFDLGSGASVTLTLPIGDAVAIEVTYEPPGDADAGPSPHRLLQGPVVRGRADLSLIGAVTQSDLPLREHPGQFTMFTPSDNSVHGYPSFEESGVWLFNMAPRDTPQRDMWVRLTQLAPGWVYEGWMVRDLDSPSAVWLSYGKFTPDGTGALSSRDDTGWGPFSGVTDFLTAGEEDFPGDDWISNPLGYSVPGNLSLPLNLREKTAAGAGRWTHVITIEPSSDRGEAIATQRPFVVRPYRDSFGDGGPGVPRAITFRPEGVPRGQAIVQ
ncbi:MAG: anti-sigma factor [Gemmatimonadetes bacterium]|nr:anti-sigma factor [Gemmatimonadota bacterium]